MKRPILLGLSIAILLGLINGPLAAQRQDTPAAARSVIPSVNSGSSEVQVGRAGQITTPKEHLGFNLGDDYCLANYQQLMSYWAKLEKESDRLKVVEMGKTEEGRPHLMGVITSAVNHKKLDYYRKIAARLARAEGVSDAE